LKTSMKRSTKVLKFGGSSVRDGEQISRVIEIISSQLKNQKLNQNSPKILAVVFSAHEGVTNQLNLLIKSALTSGGYSSQLRQELENLLIKHLDIANHLVSSSSLLQELSNKIEEIFSKLSSKLDAISVTKECSKRLADSILEVGELSSSLTISYALDHKNIDNTFIDSREIFVSNSNFSAARILKEASLSRIKERFALLPANTIAVMPGFIAADQHGITTTLGRGGSDYSAAFLGAALDASCIEIWSDVDGIMTCDPRQVSSATVIPEISFAEAESLSRFGAKVIYPPSLLPAAEKGIEIKILNSFQPQTPGTIIKESVSIKRETITGIASIADVSVITLIFSSELRGEKIIARCLEKLAANSIRPLLLNHAAPESSLTIAFAEEDYNLAITTLSEIDDLDPSSYQIKIDSIIKEVSLITVVGDRMRDLPGTSARVFKVLGSNGINIIAIAQGTSERYISVLIKARDQSKALNALHSSFFSYQVNTLNLYLIGCGLIGGTLLRQLALHGSELKEKIGLEIKLVGVANSKQLLIAESGVSPQTAIKQLSQAAKIDSPLEQLLQEISRLNLPNSIFVDCSASQDVAGTYLDLLKHGVAIVTPNKKAQSREYDYYLKLKHTARLRGVDFLYETSVGAALPVLNTLSDLIRSGDQLLKLEAVLSGTLSFVFNTFCKESLPFSQVVKLAKEQGYTEPDPRDDLNCLDVARKLTILARDAGIQLELDQVEIKPFIPQDLFALKNVTDFLEKLSEYDRVLEQLKAKALKNGARLVCLAKLESGRATVEVREVDATHPFYALSGADNALSFTTKRYSQRPLVIKGPGAGAEVTAAGVFADIIRIGANKLVE
jgi:aspartokinase/homoserine dehydrogenase 1